MEKQYFRTVIDAPREKVWQVLWADKTYREWTAPFCEGSYAVSDFKKGSKVLFLSPGENGMVSVVNDVRPNEYMSFKHLGEVKGGVEDTESEAVKKWAGAMENYTLRTKDGKTEVEVEMDMDISSGFTDYLLKTWPVALQKLKEITEN